jgi:hypothetical protein
MPKLILVHWRSWLLAHKTPSVSCQCTLLHFLFSSAFMLYSSIPVITNIMPSCINSAVTAFWQHVSLTDSKISVWISHSLPVIDKGKSALSKPHLPEHSEFCYLPEVSPGSNKLQLIITLIVQKLMHCPSHGISLCTSPVTPPVMFVETRFQTRQPHTWHLQSACVLNCHVLMSFYSSEQMAKILKLPLGAVQC